jgi:hypothetical protein
MMAVNRFGLSELYTCASPTVDLIFVHGLNGHPRDTWTAPGSGTFWPADLLRGNIPDGVRVLTYGYNATAGDLLGMESSDRIHNHAWTLLQKLWSSRVCLVPLLLLEPRLMRDLSTKTLKTAQSSFYAILWAALL